METVDRESVRDSLGSQQASEKSNRITASKAAKLNEDYNREGDFQLKSPYLVQGNAPSKRPESPHTVFSPVDHDANSFIISKTQKVTNVGDLHQSRPGFSSGALGKEFSEVTSVTRYSHYQNQQLKLVFKETLSNNRAGKPFAKVSLPPPIRSLGPYQIVKEIGKGSTGMVQLAVHADTKEHVAIKSIVRIRPGMDLPKNSKESVAQREKRIFREASVLYLLKHPNIVGLRDFFVCDEYFCMIFEYVEGIQMLDYIISNGKLKEKAAIKFMRQLVSAVDYCHQNSIVHRDLKIENVMVDQTGNARILDFGLANFYRPGEHLNTFCGSLYFAAPELLHGRVYTGPEVDIWSLGIIMFVLVCGRVPFDDQHLSVLHRKIKNCEITYPSHLSKDCVDLLKKMINPDPSKRITMPDIIDHPWMNQGYSFTVKNFMNDRVPLESVDDSIVDYMAKEFRFIYKYGQIVEVLNKACENWSAVHNHPIVSLYYLVRDKMYREGISSLSMSISRPAGTRSPSCPELILPPPGALKKQEASAAKKTRNLAMSVPVKPPPKFVQASADDSLLNSVEIDLGRARIGRSVSTSNRNPTYEESPLNVRTVYLKGLFSVNHTTKKSPYILRQELLDILLKCAIDFQDHGSVFVCEYQPSLRSLSSGEIGSPIGSNIKRATIGDHKIGFEIHIVKVAVFGVHGILFKKLYGDISLYKTMCNQILSQLDL